MKEYHIYCHIPYCKKRCKYCYFTAKYKEDEVVALHNLDRYVDAVTQDIMNTEIPLGRLNSIVFGGGTPSLLNKEQLEKIMNAIRKKVTDNVFSNVEYFAYEVSPDTASYNTLSAFRENGFNRISIGVQSFDDTVLRILGRPYHKEQVIKAMKYIREFEYELVNIDLLIGTPGQTQKSMLESVIDAIRLKPEHISVSLFYKSYPGGTEFVEECKERGYDIIPLQERMEVYETICDVLEIHGYIRVDNTVFSLPGYIYGYEKDSICGTRSVLAFGPGASGYWNNAIRYTPPEINKYIEKQESINEKMSVKTNAYATIWGHLNAYGKILVEDIKTNFNMTIQELIASDSSSERLINLLQQYNCIQYVDGTYSLVDGMLNRAIVIMHYDKDERGYQLITASEKIKKEYDI